MSVTVPGYRLIFCCDVEALRDSLDERDTPAARELSAALRDERYATDKRGERSFRFYPHPVVVDMLDEALETVR